VNFFTKIPADVSDLPQWVVWSSEIRNGKQTKVPRSAKSGGCAGTTEPENWATFSEDPQSRTLLTQAEKARQFGVSRFTIRKLTSAGRLHPVELSPWLLRYRAEELIS
jgi:hypothetical protein